MPTGDLETLWGDQNYLTLGRRFPTALLLHHLTGQTGVKVAAKISLEPIVSLFGHGQVRLSLMEFGALFIKQGSQA